MKKDDKGKDNGLFVYLMAGRARLENNRPGMGEFIYYHLPARLNVSSHLYNNTTTNIAMGFSDLFSRRKEKKERELYGRPGAGGASLRVDTSRYGSGTEPRSRAPTRRYTDAEPERKHKAAKSEPRRQNTVQTRRSEYEMPRRHKTGTPPHSPQRSFKSPANISTRRKPVPRYADVPIHSPKPRKPPGWFVPPVVYYDDKERSRSRSNSRHGRRGSAW